MYSKMHKNLVCVATVALVILIFPSSNAFWGSSEDSLWKEAEDTFLAETQLMEEKFQMQTEDTWLQITSTVANTLKAKPPQHPAVITALLPPDMDNEFATCFLRWVGLAVNKAVGPLLKSEKRVAPLTITSESFEKHSITNVRNSIETYFKKEGKALLVLDIQNFTNSENLQVFHGLCDNYNSIDARATILFLVRVPEHIYEKNRPWRHSMGGAISNEVLTKAWENVVNQNTGPALIARVADAVILLNTGDKCNEIAIDRHEGFIDDTSKTDGSTISEMQTLRPQLSKILTNLQNLETNVAANHIEMRNAIQAVKNETTKINERVLDIEFKLDAFVLSQRQAHVAQQSDFRDFKYQIYAAFAVIFFAIMSITWKTIHPQPKQVLPAKTSSLNTVQHHEDFTHHSTVGHDNYLQYGNVRLNNGVPLTTAQLNIMQNCIARTENRMPPHTARPEDDTQCSDDQLEDKQSTKNASADANLTNNSDKETTNELELENLNSKRQTRSSQANSQTKRKESMKPENHGVSVLTNDNAVKASQAQIQPQEQIQNINDKLKPKKRNTKPEPGSSGIKNKN